MGKDLTSFEQSLKDSLNNYEVPFNETKWQELEQRMEGASASKGSSLAAAAVTVLILLSGFTYFMVTKTDAPDVSGISGSDKIEVPVKNGNEAELVNPAHTDNSSLNNTSGSIDSGQIVESNDSNMDVGPSEKTSQNVSDITSDVNTIQKSTAIADVADKVETSNDEIENGQEVLDSVVEEVSNEGENNSSEMTDVPVFNEDLGPAISTSASKACVGELIKFTAENVTEENNFLWNFGNGDFSTEISTERSFNEPGQYNVSLILSNTSTKKESVIEILPKPIARFTQKNVEPGSVTLSNLSQKAEKCIWEVEGEFYSSEINPLYHYTASGKREVKLHVENEFGCTDEFHRTISLDDPYVAVGITTELKQGEYFEPTLRNIDSNITLTVFNLNGQMIFESSSSEKGWDGKMPDDSFAEIGDEFGWLLESVDPNGNSIKRSGKFTIIP